MRSSGGRFLMLILTSKPRSFFREGKNVKGTQAYIFNNNIVKADVGSKHLVLYLDIKQNNEKINIKVYSVHLFSVHLGTPFLQNTSGGCFCSQNSHRYLRWRALQQ